MNQNTLVITKCADTWFVPPAKGVIVNAVVSSTGLIILRNVLRNDVCIKHMHIN